jgi:hypothetical protein
MQSDYAGKMSHKIIPPLLAERGAGRGEESNQGQLVLKLSTTKNFGYHVQIVSSQIKKKKILPTSFTGHKGVLLKRADLE